MKAKYFVSILFCSMFLYLQLYSQNWDVLPTLVNGPPIPTMAAANGKIYILSGSNAGTSLTHEYDPVTNQWTNKAAIPQSCVWATATEFNGKIYVIGGGQSNVKKPFNQIYDPLTDTWTNGADLITPRMYQSASVVNGMIYIIGGQNGDNTTEWQFDGYNPATDKWKTFSKQPHNGAWYCAAAGVDKSFYRIAGGGWTIIQALDYFDSYNTETDAWETLTAFPLKLHASSAVTLQGKIYLMGGITNQVSIDSIYIYNPESGIWSLSLNKLPEPMVYHRTAVIGNYIYVYYQSDVDNTGHFYRYKFGTTDVDENLTNINLDLELTPNPCINGFNINYNGLLSKNINIKVFNILGEEIYSNIEQIETITGLSMDEKRG